MKSTKPKPIKLTAKELESLRILVQTTPPGTYTLRQLYGEDAWQRVRRPQALGLGFKAMVQTGKITGIRCFEKRSDRAQLYEVLPRADEVEEPTDTSEALA